MIKLLLCVLYTLRDGMLKVNIHYVQGRTFYSAEQFAKKGVWTLDLNKGKLKMVRGIYTVSIFINDEETSASMRVYNRKKN